MVIDFEAKDFIFEFEGAELFDIEIGNYKFDALVKFEAIIGDKIQENFKIVEIKIDKFKFNFEGLEDVITSQIKKAVILGMTSFRPDRVIRIEDVKHKKIIFNNNKELFFKEALCVSK